MQCSQHMQKERAAELLCEANARRLDQHAYRGLGPRCSELRGSCGGRAAEEGQVDQDARAQRPLTSFTDSFSPLIIRSSFLTSPPAAQKEALNGCTLGGASSRISAPGGEIEGWILGNLGTAETMVGCFVRRSAPIVRCERSKLLNF